MPDGTMARTPFRARAGQRDPLVIGFVNAMPPAAMRSAEGQFRAVLEAASGMRGVRLRYFALPGLATPANDHVPPGHHYESLDRLWDSHVDALIVTGTEPREADITREACWPVMARLIDWASEHTISTIWSCFAAHAAVFRLDGIRRQTFGQKLSGVFTCARYADHPLVADAPSSWDVPHSRYNTLDERELIAAGYEIVSGAPRLGADVFIKQGPSLFVMLQGHPEYGADTLLREYRRDVMRFLTGQRNAYPEIPEHYFPTDIVGALMTVREQALRRPSLELLAAFDALAPGGLAPRWRDDAVRLFSRWLDHVAEHSGIYAGREALG